jgi:hypothetical protein
MLRVKTAMASLISGERYVPDDVMFPTPVLHYRIEGLLARLFQAVPLFSAQPEVAFR